MRGQGALEYLLMVGGAVALAAVVVYAVFIFQSQTNQEEEFNEIQMSQECESTCSVCMEIATVTQPDIDACTNECKERGYQKTVDVNKCNWDCNPDPTVTCPSGGWDCAEWREPPGMVVIC